MPVTVRKKDKNSDVYYVFLNHQGRRKAWKGGSEFAAESLAADIRRQLLVNADALFAPTVSEFVKPWLQSIRPPVLAVDTYRKRVGHMDNYVLPWFGAYNIATIDRSVIRDQLAKGYQSGLSATLVDAIIWSMSAMFTRAIDDGLREHNPVKGLRESLNLPPRQKDNIFPLTPSEVDATLAVVDPSYYVVILLLFDTGTRIGEALASNWTRMNLCQGVYSVSTSTGGLTKTRKARQIELSPRLIAALQVERIKHQQALARNPSRPDLVFQHRNKTLDVRKVRAAFHQALKKAGISQRRLHDTRHTYISSLLNQGRNPKWVQSQSGHASVKELFDTYWRYIPMVSE